MQTSTRRIVENTLKLYLRQILVLFVSLYTSRVVLQTLGEQDYGVYTVVGSFVTLFSVISGAFTSTVSRFMAFELGKNDMDRMQKIYSSSLIIQTGMGIVVCTLIGIIGAWYVKNEMVMDARRTNAALWVLFFSAVTFFFNMLSLPYNSLIVAHERMGAFAAIGIVEALLKLLVAFALGWFMLDKLILYGFLMLLSAIAIRILYAVYCRRSFSECRFKFVFDRNLFSEMLSFTGWAFLGNGSFVIKSQGANLLLNQFGGPPVNAAYGVAAQVNSAITSFANNFMQAVRPQITKLYAAEQFDQMHLLLFRSARFSYYLLLILCLPVIKNIDYVLSLWLGSAPAHSSAFIILLLAYALVDSLSQPVMTGLLAEGNIRGYEIWLFILNMLNIPSSYAALKAGMQPEIVYVIALLICVCIGILRVWLARRTLRLSIRAYAAQVLFRVAVVTLCAGAAAYMICLPVDSDFGSFVLTTFLVVSITGCAIFLLGMNRAERQTVISWGKRRFSGRKKK